MLEFEGIGLLEMHVLSIWNGRMIIIPLPYCSYTASFSVVFKTNETCAGLKSSGENI
jgi:hypothetical protein